MICTAALIVVALSTVTPVTLGVGPEPFAKLTCTPSAKPVPLIVAVKVAGIGVELGDMALTVRFPAGADTVTEFKAGSLVAPSLSVTRSVTA